MAKAITAAVDELARDRSAMSLEAAKREVYLLLKEGIRVSVADTEPSPQPSPKGRGSGSWTPHPGPLPGRGGEGGSSTPWKGHTSSGLRPPSPQRVGQKPVHERRRPVANLGTAAAGRVIRALLAPENAGMRWTHQTLIRECQPGVSLGLVNKIARYLRDERYVEYLPLPDEGLRLREPLGLLVMKAHAIGGRDKPKDTY